MRSTFSIPLGLRLRLRPRQVLWLVYALFFVAGVAQAAIVPLLPLLAGRYSLSPAQTALLLALPGLATLAVSVPAGLAADRFGARRVTLSAGALLCLLCLAQAAPSLPALLVGRILFGIAFGVIWTTGMAWLAELDGGRGESLGPSVTCSSVGIMAGPAVGGVLAQATGVGVPFLAIAVVAGVVLTRLAIGDRTDHRCRRRASGHEQGIDRHDDRADDSKRRGDEPAAGDAQGGSTSLRSLARQARQPGVGAAAGALMVSGAVSGVSQLLISSGLHRDGVSSARIGLAFSASALCYIAVSAAVLRLGNRARTLRFNALATGILSVALVPALASGEISALVFALLLTAMPRAAVGTIAYSLASGSKQGGDGSAFGMVNGAWAAAMVVMPLLAGAVEEHGGARAAYLAVIVPAVAVATVLAARSRAGWSGAAVPMSGE